MTTAPKPFPFDALPRCARGDVALLRSFARRLDLPSARSADGWATLLGAPLRARAGLAVTTPFETALSAHSGLSLCAVFAHPRVGVAVLAMPRPFARVMALRALEVRDDLAPHAALDTLSLAEEGALFALVSHVATRAFAPHAPPVLRAITDDAVDAMGAIGDAPTLIAWPFDVTVGGDSARVTLIASVAPLARALEALAPRDSQPLDVPVATALVAARARWTASELSSLTVFEVLSLDDLRHTREGLSGEVTVRVANHLESRARLDAGAVTLTDAIHPVTEPMTDTNDRSEAGARIASLPIELTVEIARGESTVADVSAWRPGEVVPFATPIGAEVLVRANGRVVARGELVDVDGVVGVRITALV